MDMTPPKLEEEDTETILLHSAKPLLPPLIKNAIEKHVGSPNSVLCLLSFFGGKYLCTIYGKKALEQLHQQDTQQIIIENQVVPYEAYDNVKRVIIKNVPTYLRLCDVNNAISRYGKIIWSNIECRPTGDVYVSMVLVKKEVPKQVYMRCFPFKVLCI